MRKIFYTLSLIALTLGVNAQLLLNENFGYTTGQLTSNTSGANVSGGVWTNFSGTGTFVPVVAGSLTYPGYLSTSGNKIMLTAVATSAEDDSAAFAAVSSGSIYVSFLLNVIDTSLLNVNSSANGDYFFLLAQNSTTFFSRVSIRKGAVGNTYNLGMRHSSTGTTVWGTTDYAVNTTQLVVLKYTFVASTTNDQTALWVNPVLGTTEPTPTVTALNVSSTDPTSLSSIAVRQGSTSGLGTPNAYIDGIRIGTSWSLGALPVSWKSFTATKGADANTLKWSTASETNNNNFEVQRSIDGKKYETIGSVKGAGNSAKTSYYSFEDKDRVSAKTVFYRLKQVDFDGNASYSKTVSIVAAEAKSGLDASLPNPFNDALTITFNSTASSTATVTLMDMIGKVYFTSEEHVSAGANKVNIGTTDMPNGIYFVRVSSNGETFTQKVIKK